MNLTPQQITDAVAVAAEHSYLRFRLPAPADIQRLHRVARGVLASTAGATERLSKSDAARLVAAVDSHLRTAERPSKLKDIDYSALLDVVAAIESDERGQFARGEWLSDAAEFKALKSVVSCIGMSGDWPDIRRRVRAERLRRTQQRPIFPLGAPA